MFFKKRFVSLILQQRHKNLELEETLNTVISIGWFADRRTDIWGVESWWCPHSLLLDAEEGNSLFLTLNSVLSWNHCNKGRPVRETYGVVCLLVLHTRMFHLERLFPAIGLSPPAPKRDRFFCSLDQPKTEYAAKNDLELLVLLTSFCKLLVVYTLGVEVGLCASAGTLPAKLGSQPLAARLLRFFCILQFSAVPGVVYVPAFLYVLQSLYDNSEGENVAYYLLKVNKYNGLVHLVLLCRNCVVPVSYF